MNNFRDCCDRQVVPYKKKIQRLESQLEVAKNSLDEIYEICGELSHDPGIYIEVEKALKKIEELEGTNEQK